MKHELQVMGMYYINGNKFFNNDDDNDNDDHFETLLSLHIIKLVTKHLFKILDVVKTGS
jgi:hypothetical protein